MRKMLWVGVMLASLCVAAQAEVTARHSYVSFETVRAATEGAKADELVRLVGHITSEPTDGVYVVEDGSGCIEVVIPQEMRAGMTIRTDVRYELLGRAVRLPFEALRIEAEAIKAVSP